MARAYNPFLALLDEEERRNKPVETDNFGNPTEETEDSFESAGDNPFTSLLKAEKAREKALKEQQEAQEMEQAAQAQNEEDAKAKEEASARPRDDNWLSRAIDQLNMHDNDRTWKQGEAQGEKSNAQQSKEIISSIFSGTEKVGDSIEAITGIAERRQKHWDKQLQEKKITFEEYQKLIQGQMQDTAWAGTGYDEEGNKDSGFDNVKRAAGVSLEATSELIPFMKGAKAVQAGVKSGAAFGAGVGAVHGTGAELSDGQEFDIERVGLEAALGGLAGGAGGYLSRGGKPDPTFNGKTELDEPLTESVDTLSRSLDGEDAVREAMDTTNKPLQLDDGSARIQRRLDEIDEELGNIQGGSKFEADPTSMDNLGTERRPLTEEKYILDETPIKEVGRVVYHGTNADFKAKPKTGRTATKKGGFQTTSEMAFFSDNKEVSKFFAKDRTKGLGGRADVGEYVLDDSQLFDFSSDWSDEGIIRSFEKLGYKRHELYTQGGDFTNLLDTKLFRDRLIENGYKGVKFQEKGGNTYGIVDESLYKRKTGQTEIGPRGPETPLEKFVIEGSEGTSTVTKGSFKNNAEQFKKLRKERTDLVRERDSLKLQQEASIARQEIDPEIPIVDQAKAGNPQAQKVLDEQLEAVEKHYFSDVNKDYTPGILAALKTPERYMQKAGLGKVMEKVREGWDNFGRAENAHLKQIADWASTRGITKGSEVKIAQALDGKTVKLNAGEQQVFDAMRASYDDFAEKLGLPPGGQISEYLPHIFKNNPADPELLRLQKKFSSGKIKNPFRQKRTGAEGYIDDAFEIYRIYSRKAEMDINLAEGMDLLNQSKAKVSRSMAEEINDLMNTIKRLPEADSRISDSINEALEKAGFAPNAAERGSSAARAAIYRATLGFNTGSALRNFTQNANTLSEIGSKWTALGAKDAMQNMVKRNFDEVIDMGVLDDTFLDSMKGVSKAGVQSKVRKAGKMFDSALWAQFNTTEQFNRLTAYYGAKAQGIAKGMTEAEAKKYAAGIARKTQFKFSPIDTPRWFRGSVSKNLTQFMSFNVKQVEFIKDRIVGTQGMFVKQKGGGYKLSAEGAWKLTRLAAANGAFYYTVGQAIGMRPTDMIPFWGNASEGEMPMSPITGLILGSDSKLGVTNLLSGKDQYGDDKSRGELAQGFLGDSLAPLTIPGGVQFNKTKDALDAMNDGASTTKSGDVRFLTEGTNSAQNAIFGQYSSGEARDYFERDGSPLSEKQSEIVLNLPPEKQKEYYDFFTFLKDDPAKKSITADRVREAVKDKNFEKAKRITAQYNRSIADKVMLLEKQTGEIDKDVLEYMGTFMIDFNYYKNNKEAVK